MNSKEHFLQIYLSLPVALAKGATVAITAQELAQMLYCTTRNVKIIMRKLVDEGIVDWRAGVGRGNPSQLTLLRDLDDVLDAYFQELLSKGRMKDAIDLLYKKDLPSSLRSRLQGMLENQFGFQVEHTRSAKLDVLRVVRIRKLGTLDPGFVFIAAEAYFLEQICSTLINFDARKKRFMPNLAHTWESCREERTWTFFLRKGVRFHHGRVMTAKDVAYTLQRLRDVNSTSLWQFEDIESVEIVDDYTITFHLKQPNGFMLHFFSSISMSILPFDVPFDEQAIIGTGPFRVAQRTEQVFILEAFGDYFRERALLDRVELWQVPEASSLERTYMLPYLTSDPEAEEESEGQLEYYEVGCRYLIFNFRKAGIQHDPAFRTAMRILYDRAGQVSDLGGNRIAPANSFLPEKSTKYAYPSRSLDEASEWLRQSGYNGETIKLYHYEKCESVEDAIWLQQRAQSIGLHLSLHPFAVPDTYLIDLDCNADMVLAGEVIEEDMEWGLLRLFRDKSTFIHQLLLPEQHALLESHLHDFVRQSAESRERSYDAAEQMLRDQNWLLFGYHASKHTRYHPALKGVAFDSFGWVDFSKLWIKPSLSRH